MNTEYSLNYTADRPMLGTAIKHTVQTAYFGSIERQHYSDRKRQMEGEKQGVEGVRERKCWDHRQRVAIFLKN